jgi:hypothetical protein
MANLIYIANTSLDGYVEDRDGGIQWGTPDEEYFSSINDVQRPIGTYLYGRRMYEAMLYWETAPIADQPDWVQDFTNIWLEADKVVFSKTLPTASSARTTLEREFEVDEGWRYRRPHGGWSGSRCPSVSGGAGRRMPLVFLASRIRRRQTSAPPPRATGFSPAQ